MDADERRLSCLESLFGARQRPRQLLEACASTEKPSEVCTLTATLGLNSQWNNTGN